MSKIIFSRPEDGSVTVVHPANGIATDELAAKTVPEGVEYQIVERDIVFPPDELFFNAWTWGGKDQPILEDLEKSKVIENDRVKAETRNALQVVADAALFDDPVVRTADQLKVACSDVREQINAAKTPYEAKVLMCAYCGDPAPALPRDQQLEAGLEAKLQELREAKIAEIQGKVEKAQELKDWLAGEPATMPAPEPKKSKAKKKS